MANINKISVAGTIYDIQDQHASKTVELTQSEYDGLAVKNPNTFYIITDAQGGNLSNYYTKTEVDGKVGDANLIALEASNDVKNLSATVSELDYALTEHTADTTVHVTSAEKTSWDGAATNASNAVTALGGLKLVKLTQSQYDALQTKDANTLYIING